MRISRFIQYQKMIFLFHLLVNIVEEVVVVVISDRWRTTNHDTQMSSLSIVWCFYKSEVLIFSKKSKSKLLNSIIQAVLCCECVGEGLCEGLCVQDK